MSSPFDLLQETPRPYLDCELLKAKFLKLSSPLHPDRVHHLSEEERMEATRQFSELNAAYLLLKDPRQRINLLLEKETGTKPKDIQKIPPGTMDLFVEVGQFCRDLDTYLETQKTVETSPLLKAANLRQKNQWQIKFQMLQSKIDAKQNATLEELKKVDAEWIAASDHHSFLERLENIGRLFSYIARWSQQLAERSVQLEIS